MAEVATPYQALATGAEKAPGHPCILAPASARLPWAPHGYCISYGDALAETHRLRDAYIAAGYGRGSRVALLMGNRPEFILHWMALNAIGASAVPINGDTRPDELRHQMTVSQAECVIAAPGFETLLAAGVPDGVPVAAPDAPIPAAPVRRSAEGGHPDDEAALLFTSGSTGKPKACILSNHYFLNVARWYTTMPGIAAMTPGQEVSLTPLPFFHMNALGCTVVGMLTIGGTIVPLDRFHPDRWWATIADSGATIVHSLGVIPAILLQRPPGPDDRRHRARFTFGPGVDAQHRVAFESRFNLPIVEGWAMTETGAGAITDTAGVAYDPGRRCIGVARGDMEWRIVDDAGQDVPPGQPGELWCRTRGPDPRRGFFSGYLGDPAATEAAWEGGWFHTGDIMSVDEAGRFYFVDRKKSIVRRSGENISALEVEAALAADPAVQAVAVTPVSDPVRDEEVFAFVVPAGDAPDAETLLARVGERLSYHKLPGWLVFTGALPVSSTNKLQRGEIRARAEAAVANGAALDLRKLKRKLRHG
ncbi:MAG: AMP-binding protein [Gemmobacter sp.]|uniref:AMP-binding protein n=1 Tax=Gemmobacter sp. TaxID=1898957 RepID=UPI00391DCF0B